jgi:hypothetical protein
MTCHAIYWQKAKTKSKDIGGSDRLTGGSVCQTVKNVTDSLLVKEFPAFYGTPRVNCRFYQSPPPALSTCPLHAAYYPKTVNMSAVSMTADYCLQGQSQLSRDLRRRSAPLVCWDCGFESHCRHGCLSAVSVVFWQVEVSAADRSLVQRNPTDCVPSLCVI